MEKIIQDKLEETKKEYKIRVNLRPVNLLIADYILEGEINNIFEEGKNRIKIIMDLTGIEPFCHIYNEETGVAFSNGDRAECIKIYSMDFRIYEKLRGPFKGTNLKEIKKKLHKWFGPNDLIEQAQISEEDLYESVSDYMYVGNEVLVLSDLVKECEKAFKVRQTLLVTIIEGILEDFQREVKETTEKLIRGLI